MVHKWYLRGGHLAWQRCGSFKFIIELQATGSQETTQLSDGENKTSKTPTVGWRPEDTAEYNVHDIDISSEAKIYAIQSRLTLRPTQFQKATYLHSALCFGSLSTAMSRG